VAFCCFWDLQREKKVDGGGLAGNTKACTFLLNGRAYFTIHCSWNELSYEILAMGFASFGSFGPRV